MKNYKRILSILLSASMIAGSALPSMSVSASDIMEDASDGIVAETAAAEDVAEEGGIIAETELETDAAIEIEAETQTTEMLETDVQAEADVQKKDAVVTSVNITVSAQQENTFLAMPQSITVSSDEAEKFGYTDETGKVTTLDALVAVHELVFGTDYTRDTANTMLTVSDYGTITTMFGTETTSVSFAVNGVQPNDGIYNEAYKAYTGYTVTQAPLKNGDVVDYFFMQDSYWMDNYGWFTNGDKKATDLTVETNIAFDLTLKGYAIGLMGCNPQEDIDKTTAAIEDAEVYEVDSKGTRISDGVSGTTDETGAVSFKFATEGVHYLMAVADADDYPMISPICKVTVAKVNHAPKLKDSTVTETDVYNKAPGNGGSANSYVNLSEYFEDPDGDSITYTVKKDGVIQEDFTGSNLKITFSDPAKYIYTVTASDGEFTSTDILTINAYGVSGNITFPEKSGLIHTDYSNYLYIYPDDSEKTEIQLSATLLPEGVDQTVVWSGGKSKVMELDQTGKMTIYKNDETQYNLTAYLQKEEIYVASMSLRIYPEKPDFSKAICDVVMPEDGRVLSRTTFANPDDNYSLGDFTLEAADPEVADVTIANSKISVLPKKTGSTEVTATWKYDENVKTTFMVNVKGVSVSTSDGKKSIEYEPDKTVQLTAQGTTDGETFEWKSSDTTVAEVDKNGLVTLQGTGTVTVTATSSLSTSDAPVKGGIILNVVENDKYYLDNLAFTGYSNFGWKTADSGFSSGTMSYSMNSTNASYGYLAFTPTFDAEKATAKLQYQVSGGAYQVKELTSGTAENIADALMPGHNKVKIQIISKANPSKVVTYSFDFFRPYTTTKTLSRLSVLPNGTTALAYPKYENQIEGTLFKYNDQIQGSNGFSSASLDYIAYVYGKRTDKVTLNATFGDVFEKVYISQDGGTPVEMVSGWPTAEIKMPASGETLLKIETMSSQGYADNDNVFAAENTYTVLVKSVTPLGIDAEIKSAVLSAGDFYAPGFSNKVYASNILIPAEATSTDMTFTVADDIKVYKGSVSTTNLLTPKRTEDGVATYEATLTPGYSATQICLQSVDSEDSTKTGVTNYSFTVKQKNTAGIQPDEITEYLCLGSQYTNASNYGMMPERTLIANGSALSLGNFGGYITYKYDTPIENSNLNPNGVDFIVYGNSFGNGGEEPGSVMVSEDGINWYMLAGSCYYDDYCDWNYSMTYTKNAAGYAPWTGLNGLTTEKYQYPLAVNYPYFNWNGENKSSMTVSGCLLNSEFKDAYGSAAAVTPDFGYADVKTVPFSGKGSAGNPYNGSTGAGDAFDISWAVDANGMPVQLDSISYIKVATASCIYGGAIGEKSTEVAAVYRTQNTLSEAAGKTETPEISINGEDLDIPDASGIYTMVYEGELEVEVTAAEGTNVYINDKNGASRTYETAPEKGILRIIAQEGEKEPAIVYVKLRTKTKAEITAAAVIKQIDELGTITLAKENAVKAARTAYNSLSTEAKALVTNLDILTTAESTLNQLQTEKSAAEAVIAQINELGTVTLNNEAAVKAAREAYDKLPAAAKAQVTNLNVLTSAETTITKLKDEKKQQDTLKTATAVKLSSTSITLLKGETFKLTADMEPANCTDTMKFTSSNTKVVTVMGDGTITAEKKGTATITATTGSGKTASCKINVKEIKAKKVKLNKKKITLKKGKTYTLKATMKPKNSTDKLVWKSSNKKVATVSSSGKIKAKKKGTTKITVKTASGKKATCTIKVK